MRTQNDLKYEPNECVILCECISVLLVHFHLASLTNAIIDMHLVQVLSRNDQRENVNEICVPFSLEKFTLCCLFHSLTVHSFNRASKHNI